VMELSKLDLSHNELEGTLPDAMFVPLSELSVSSIRTINSGCCVFEELVDAWRQF
jgi:hypothetical protein